jgi:hypothetical protein
MDIVSRATRGITLPSPKKTRAHIVHMFKQQMYLLKKHLNVRSHFPSLILLTFTC